MKTPVTTPRDLSFRTILFFSLVLCLVALSGCGQAREAEAAIESDDYFFSLERYFRAEAARLQDGGSRLEKTIRINDRTETLRLTKVDYTREFSLFRKADINRPAWTDKYRADTTRVGDEIRRIQYTGLDPELKTRDIDIEFDGTGQVVRIAVNTATATALAGNQSALVYQPAVGYRILTTQENRTAETLEIELEGRFE